MASRRPLSGHPDPFIVGLGGLVDGRVVIVSQIVSHVSRKGSMSVIPDQLSLPSFANAATANHPPSGGRRSCSCTAPKVLGLDARGAAHARDVRLRRGVGHREHALDARRVEPRRPLAPPPPAASRVHEYTPPPAAQGVREYTPQSGDTWGSAARRGHVSTACLHELSSRATARGRLCLAIGSACGPDAVRKTTGSETRMGVAMVKTAPSGRESDR